MSPETRRGTLLTFPNGFEFETRALDSEETPLQAANQPTPGLVEVQTGDSYLYIRTLQRCCSSREDRQGRWTWGGLHSNITIYRNRLVISLFGQKAVKVSERSKVISKATALHNYFADRLWLNVRLSLSLIPRNREKADGFVCGHQSLCPSDHLLIAVYLSLKGRAVWHGK